MLRILSYAKEEIECDIIAKIRILLSIIAWPRPITCFPYWTENFSSTFPLPQQDLTTHLFFVIPSPSLLQYWSGDLYRSIETAAVFPGPMAG